MALQQISQELKEIRKGTGDWLSVSPIADDMFNWEAKIAGPAGSPYEGGVFHLSISFPQNYPESPPKVAFRTRVWHCNIGENGSICLDILGSNWLRVFSIQIVLSSILSLLTEPNPDDPLVPQIAEMYKTDRAQYEAKARNWTQRFAM